MIVEGKPGSGKGMQQWTKCLRIVGSAMDKWCQRKDVAHDTAGVQEDGELCAENGVEGE